MNTKKKEPGWVYILRCSDNSYYVGCAKDLIKRMNEHIMGIYKGYTSTRLPIELVFSQSFDDIGDALLMEKQLKGWTRKKKEALINGDIKLLHKLSRCKNDTSNDFFRKIYPC